MAELEESIRTMMEDFGDRELVYEEKETNSAKRDGNKLALENRPSIQSYHLMVMPRIFLNLRLRLNEGYGIIHTLSIHPSERGKGCAEETLVSTLRLLRGKASIRRTLTCSVNHPC